MLGVDDRGSWATVARLCGATVTNPNAATAAQIASYHPSYALQAPSQPPHTVHDATSGAPQAAGHAANTATATATATPDAPEVPSYTHRPTHTHTHTYTHTHTCLELAGALVGVMTGVWRDTCGLTEGGLSATAWHPLHREYAALCPFLQARATHEPYTAGFVKAIANYQTRWGGGTCAQVLPASASAADQSTRKPSPHPASAATAAVVGEPSWHEKRAAPLDEVDVLLAMGDNEACKPAWVNRLCVLQHDLTTCGRLYAAIHKLHALHKQVHHPRSFSLLVACVGLGRCLGLGLTVCTHYGACVPAFTAFDIMLLAPATHDLEVSSTQHMI